MYIIEKILRIYFKYKNRNNVQNIMQEINEVKLEDVVTCKHNFMPVDSTGEILACSKCGYLIKRTRLDKNENFFNDLTNPFNKS